MSMMSYLRRRVAMFAVVSFVAMASMPLVYAQPTPAPAKQAIDNKLQEAEQKASQALKPLEAKPATEPANEPVQPNQPQGPDFFALWFQGGPLMYPITAMSFVVVLFTLERLIGLRRGRIMPYKLAEGLRQMARQGTFDPRTAYQLCQQFPSTLASVMKVVLLKVGKPIAEIEHTYKEISEREAAKLYRNVRTINLAVSVTPLIGLLGTVQGMIECFYTTANLGAGQDKSQALANGIYVALVTTFGGLVVAIPAAVLSHFFEGRIQTRFRDIDELMVNLIPQLERYEGKVRMTRQAGEPEAKSA